MATWNSQLWRAALRLDSRYASTYGDGPRVYAPEDEWLELKERIRRLQVAEFRGWTTAAARTRSALLLDLERLESRLRELTKKLRADERATRPSLRSLYEELVAAEIEFGGLEFEDGTISVATEPIVLEGILLGPFQICLDAKRVTDDMPFSVIALEPNPAASSDEVTHPHVSSARLCPGEGRRAIHAALAEGRLFDFFSVVDRILHTYAHGAAYVELNRWQGVPCHDCDATVDEGDSRVCERCEETVCGDCVIGCEACGETFCSGCCERCARCDAQHCGGCLSPCVRCRNDVCPSCIDEGVCSTCLEELEDDDEPEEESVAEEANSSDATAEPAV